MVFKKRLETKEVELAKIDEKISDLSLHHRRIKAAQKEADKDFREMIVLHEINLK